MKKTISLLITALSLSLLAVPAFAGEARVTLTWTPRPANEGVINYVVSEQLSPGRAVLGSTTGTSFVINNVSNGEHFYIVSGVNSFGEGIPCLPFRVNIFNYPFGSPGIPANLTGSVFYSFP